MEEIPVGLYIWDWRVHLGCCPPDRESEFCKHRKKSNKIVHNRPPPLLSPEAKIYLEIAKFLEFSCCQKLCHCGWKLGREGSLTQQSRWVKMQTRLWEEGPSPSTHQGPAGHKVQPLTLPFHWKSEHGRGGCGDGSAGRELAGQPWEPEFKTPSPHERMLGTKECACSSSAGEAKTCGSLGLTPAPCLPSWISERRLCFSKSEGQSAVSASPAVLVEDPGLFASTHVTAYSQHPCGCLQLSVTPVQGTECPLRPSTTQSPSRPAHPAPLGLPSAVLCSARARIRAAALNIAL